MPIDETIVIEPYSLEWPDRFEREVQALMSVLGDSLARFEHIGSTAVPSLAAKPVIDILGMVPALAEVEQHRTTLEQIGYAWMGESGIVGRRFLIKRDQCGRREVHLHFFDARDHRASEHLLFRDLLRRSPSLCSEYASLKQSLATEHAHNRDGYSNGKAAFIANALAMVLHSSG